MKNIKFSIIVASYNSEKTIERMILSLNNQAYGNFEIIFVDGGSVDSTIDLIKKHSIKNSIIISEPDRGIGDAWNKGLRVSTGDVFGLLNSDDYYDEDIFSKIAPYFVHLNEPLIGFGDVTVVDYTNNNRNKIIGKMRGKLALLNGFGFLHPSVFFNRKALDLNGSFNPRISVGMDTDWLLRAISNGITFRKIPSHACMMVGGHSYLNKYTGMGEYMDSLIRNGYKDFHILIFLVLRLFGCLFRILNKGSYVVK